LLILFDIDGTLLHSHGLGRAGMEAAFSELFAVEQPGHVDYGGRLDHWIYRRMCALSGIDDPERHEDAFRRLYTSHLTRLLEIGPAPSLLPGVEALLAALAAHDGVTLGLLTGNYRATGRMKIEASGLDLEAFAAGAWGEDAADRAELVPIARQRLARAMGRIVAPHEVVVVGDTEHDVSTARRNGCRSLAVANGFGSLDTLVASEPDRLVDDLTDTEGLTAWLTRGVATGGPR
jgi:phosphoglycolate phosphatase-like HAD superfamily hydrolase